MYGRGRTMKILCAAMIGILLMRKHGLMAVASLAVYTGNLIKKNMADFCNFTKKQTITLMKGCV